MNYCVPDFDIEDEDYFRTTSSLTRPNKLSLNDQDELLELVWEDGHPVTKSQNQRNSTKRPLVEDDAVTIPDRWRGGPIEFESRLNHSHDHLFMQEEEMAFWLHHYPSLESTDLYSDVIDAGPPRAAPVQDAPPSTVAQPRRSEPEPVRNFAHFSRAKPRVVESCDTPCAAAPAPAPESVASRVSGSTVEATGGGVGLCVADAGGGGEKATCEMTSSSGGSASLEPERRPERTAGDRKRKGREADDDDDGEDVEFESPDARKQICGSAPAKKSRTAEVHNLSERRRRDRINEKMKALQELIPHCNKSDKASMLDEAIEYLKSLQLQVQMISMGGSMVPMMYPSVQQYMPPMGMPMGMGRGMEMGISRPTLPFPFVLAATALPTPAAAAYMGPRFPVPAFHMPSIPLPGPSTVLKSLSPQNRDQPQMINFPGPYHQYLGLHHMQLPLPQNQAMMQPSTSREVENHRNHQLG